MNTTDDHNTNLIAYIKAEKSRVAEERKANLELREKLDLAYIETKKAFNEVMYDLTRAMNVEAIPWELVWAGENTIVLSSLMMTANVEGVGELLKFDSLNGGFGLYFKDSSNEWFILTCINKNGLSPKECLLQALKPVFSRVL